jgi:hypothetical protein
MTAIESIDAEIVRVKSIMRQYNRSNIKEIKEKERLIEMTPRVFQSVARYNYPGNALIEETRHKEYELLQYLNGLEFAKKWLEEDDAIPL